MGFSWVAEHGPERVSMRGDETVVLAAAEDAGYVCTRCQRDQCERCTDRSCGCCAGQPSG